MIKPIARRVILLGALLVALLLSLVLIGTALADLPAQEINLNYNGVPLELHADASSNLWISDYAAGEIWKVNATGTAYTVFSVGSMIAGPGDAQADASGKVWFVDDTYLRQLDPNSLAIQSWNFHTTNSIYGLGLDGSGTVWVTEPGSSTIYNVNLGTSKYYTYLVPASADFLYPLVSNNQLWLGDALNGRLLRLDFSGTPAWAYWQLPAGTTPYFLTLDVSGNVWYTDNGNASIGRLSPSDNKLTVYPLPTSTDPKMLAVSAGIVWFDGQSQASLGSLDPSQNPATPQVITKGTASASPTQKNLPSPSNETATTSGGVPSWPSTTYTTLNEGNGWSVFQLPGGSQPNGIALTSNGYVVDSLRSVLIRFSPWATPRLVVIKNVINDNGGTAVASNFTMNVTAINPSQSSFPGAESPGTELTMDPGSYNVTETGLSSYTVSYSTDCTGTIAIGQTKTCTITNDDNAPALHLRKLVTNDDGGTALPTAWTLSAAGPTPLSGTTPVDSGSSFGQGTYTLSESGGPAGYTASAWSCVKNGGAPVTGSSITLGLGDVATCTITNDDIAQGQFQIYLPIVLK